MSDDISEDSSNREKPEDTLSGIKRFSIGSTRLDGAGGPDDRVPAGFLLRLFAWIIDVCIIAVIWQILRLVILVPLTIFGAMPSLTLVFADLFDQALDPGDLRAFFVAISPLIAMVVVVAPIGLLFSFPESSARRSSPGKFLMGVYVTRYDGYKVSFQRALFRNAMKLLSYIPFGLGFFMAAFSFRKQALHDLFTNTLVVRDRAVSPQRMLISGIFAGALGLTTLSLIVTRVFEWQVPQWNYLAVSERLRTLVREHKDPVVISRRPLDKTPAPQARPDKDLDYKKEAGEFQIVGKKFNLPIPYIRVVTIPTEKVPFSPANNSVSSYKLVEVLFFENPVNYRHRMNLSGASKLIKDAQIYAFQLPLFQLNFYAPDGAEICDGKSIEHGQLVLNARHPALAIELEEPYPVLEIPEVELQNQQFFDGGCSTFESRQEYKFDLKGALPFLSGDDVGALWKFNFSADALFARVDNPASSIHRVPKVDVVESEAVKLIPDDKEGPSGKDIWKVPSKISSEVIKAALTFNNQVRRFPSTYVRLMRERRKDFQLGPRSKHEVMRKVEVAIFREVLLADDTAVLHGVADLMKQSAGMIGKAPVAVFQLFYPNKNEICSQDDVIDGEIIIDTQHSSVRLSVGERYLKLPLAKELAAVQRLFSKRCGRLVPGQTLQLNFAGTRTLIKDSDATLQWELDLRQTLDLFAADHRYQYGEHKSAAALWNAATGSLQIGFYQKKLGINDFKKIRSSKSLISMPGKMPDMVAYLELPPGLKRFARDAVRGGYKIEFLKHPDNPMPFPPGVNKITFQAGPNGIPRGLAGTAITGKQVVGRFVGELLRKWKDRETYKLDWEIPFRAVLVVIGETKRANKEEEELGEVL